MRLFLLFFYKRGLGGVRIRGMSISWSLVLGAVQGITEFLPISSSAHLILFPWLFETSDQGLVFDVALHLGSLLAIVFVFRSEWLRLFGKAGSLFKNRLKPQDHDQKMVYFLIVATVPAAVAGYFLSDLAKGAFRSPYIIVFTLVFYGVLLILADKYGRKEKGFEEISLKDALLVGLAQVLALVPGTSRSGVTITAGLFGGLKKKEAARFSFMLLAPIIFGAGVLKVPEIPSDQFLSVPLWTGVLSSLVFSLLAIKFVLKYVERHSYKIFAYYRFGLAALALAFILVR